MDSWFGKVSKGNSFVMVAIIIWISGIASAFIDNIPFSATMLPVIKSLPAASGINVAVLAFATVFIFARYL